jgi:hypothetical protein
MKLYELPPSTLVHRQLVIGTGRKHSGDKLLRILPGYDRVAGALVIEFNPPGNWPGPTYHSKWFFITPPFWVTESWHAGEPLEPLLDWLIEQYGTQYPFLQWSLDQVDKGGK